METISVEVTANEPWQVKRRIDGFKMLYNRTPEIFIDGKWNIYDEEGNLTYDIFHQQTEVKFIDDGGTYIEYEDSITNELRLNKYFPSDDESELNQPTIYLK